MSVSLHRVIHRDPHGGRAKQPLGLADPAGQRAVSVGEARALRVLAREQEAPADRFAEQVGVSWAGPRRDVRVRAPRPWVARPRGDGNRGRLRTRAADRLAEHAKRPANRDARIGARQALGRAVENEEDQDRPAAEGVESRRIPVRSTSTAGTAALPGRLIRPRCPRTASAVPGAPGREPGPPPPRTLRSPRPWMRPPRDRRAALPPPEGTPRGRGRAGPRPLSPSGGALRRSRTRPSQAPGPRSRMTHPPVARSRSAGSRPACESMTRPGRRASRPSRRCGAAGPVPPLEHDTLDSGVRQRVGDRQPRDPRAHHEHPLDRARYPTGNIGSSVIEILGSQNAPQRLAASSASIHPHTPRGDPRERGPPRALNSMIT